MEVATRMSPVYEVIDKVLAGETLRSALAGMDLTPQAFGHLLQKDKEAAVAYARAAELRADLMADEVISIADGDDDPNKARNRITARQWLAGKLNAKRYGDRIDLNVTQTLDVGATLLEARTRLRPVHDQLTQQDTQVLDVEARMTPRATDKESVPPLPAGPASTPDIFS